MNQHLLSPEETEEYETLVSSYHPSGQIVYNFARSNFTVIAGPTGVGKDTLRNALLQDPKYIKILSTTSRPLRPGEQDGVEYHFRPLPFFDQGLDERRFLQVALVHKQQLSALDANDISQLGSGQVGISLLVVQTEITLRKLNPDLKTIFLVPPDLPTLISRIQATRKVAEDELKRRLDAALSELQIALKQPLYYCIINDNIARANKLADDFLSRGLRDEQEDTFARQTIATVLNELILMEGKNES